MEPFAIVFIVLFFLLYMALIAFSVVCYVLGSKGVYTIASRRGIKNPWMAWIPVVGNWTVGSISDLYQQRKYGEDPKLRKKLLIFSIITQSGLTFMPSVGGVTLNFDLGVFDGPGSGLFGDELPEALKVALIVFMILMLMAAIAALVLSVIQTVYQYKAYYSLYASCRPQMAIAFLILSILTPAGPFVVYACRNSDEGMPPEQTPPPETLR